MTAYINELIVVIVVCQAASMLVPDSESSKRYVRVVCALVTILTLVSPVRTLVDKTDELAGAFANFFTAAEEAEDDTARGTLESAAYAVMTYAAENYDLDMDGAEITFFTDEDGGLTEVQMFVKSGNAADRDKLVAELEAELGAVVKIFIETRTDAGREVIGKSE